MNHNYFDYQKNQKTPNLSPRFWYLWWISVGSTIFWNLGLSNPPPWTSKVGAFFNNFMQQTNPKFYPSFLDFTARIQKARTSHGYDVKRTQGPFSIKNGRKMRWIYPKMYFHNQNMVKFQQQKMMKFLIKHCFLNLSFRKHWQINLSYFLGPSTCINLHSFGVSKNMCRGHHMCRQHVLG